MNRDRFANLLLKLAAFRSFGGHHTRCLITPSEITRRQARDCQQTDKRPAQATTDKAAAIDVHADRKPGQPGTVDGRYRQLFKRRVQRLVPGCWTKIGRHTRQPAPGCTQGEIERLFFLIAYQKVVHCCQDHTSGICQDHTSDNKVAPCVRRSQRVIPTDVFCVTAVVLLSLSNYDFDWFGVRDENYSGGGHLV